MNATSRTPEQEMEDDIGAAVDAQLSRERDTVELSDAVTEQHAERITAVKRTATRLLIFTSNTTVFEAGSALQARLKDLSELFSEIHVVVLNVASHGVCTRTRLTQTVWLYPLNARHSIGAYFAAKTLVDNELVFAGGFRADVILALDPFLSGYTARAVATKYARPLQIHVTVDVTSEAFQKTQKNWRIKRYLMNRVFAAQPSVRVYTKSIGRHLVELFPELRQKLEVVPQYVDLESVKSTKPSGVLHERYPQYKLKLVYIGPLTHESGVFEALEAAAPVLQYPSVGLFIVGDGEAKKELQDAASAKNLHEQVVINPPGLDKNAVLAESDILLMMGGADAYEEAVLEAAAAGVTVVAGATDFVRELFRHDESALLCEVGQTACFQTQLTRLLNENTVRRRLSRVAKSDVLDQVELNPQMYREAMKYSIERALYAYETPNADEGVIQSEDMLTAEAK